MKFAPFIKSAYLLLLRHSCGGGKYLLWVVRAEKCICYCIRVKLSGIWTCSISFQNTWYSRNSAAFTVRRRFSFLPFCRRCCFLISVKSWKLHSQHSWKAVIWSTDVMWSTLNLQLYSHLQVRNRWLKCGRQREENEERTAQANSPSFLLEMLAEVQENQHLNIHGLFSLVDILCHLMINAYHTSTVCAWYVQAQCSHRRQRVCSAWCLAWRVAVYSPAHWKHFDKTVRWNSLWIELSGCQKVTREAGGHRHSQGRHLYTWYFISEIPSSWLSVSNLPSSSLVTDETFRGGFIKTRLLLVGCITMSISTTFTSVSRGSLLFTGNANDLNITESSAWTPVLRYPCYVCSCSNTKPSYTSAS